MFRYSVTVYLDLRLGFSLPTGQPSEAHPYNGGQMWGGGGSGVSEDGFPLRRVVPEVGSININQFGYDAGSGISDVLTRSVVSPWGGCLWAECH